MGRGRRTSRARSGSRVGKVLRARHRVVAIESTAPISRGEWLRRLCIRGNRTGCADHGIASFPRLCRSYRVRIQTQHIRSRRAEEYSAACQPREVCFKADCKAIACHTRCPPMPLSNERCWTHTRSDWNRVSSVERVKAVCHIPTRNRKSGPMPTRMNVSTFRFEHPLRDRASPHKMRPIERIR